MITKNVNLINLNILKYFCTVPSIKIGNRAEGRMFCGKTHNPHKKYGFFLQLLS